MNLNSLDFYFRSFADKQMNFLYTGDFGDFLTDRLIELNNHQLNSEDEFNISQKKASFLIAECFQNIVRHSDLSNRDSYFHIKNDTGRFSLISGNTVKNELVPQLKAQIEQLNNLTTKELREVYRRVLFDGKFSDKGGAGLGLIEMARKTNNKLHFDFKKLNIEKAYFYLQLQHNSTTLLESQDSDTLSQDVSLREQMLKDQLYMVYKGVVSSQVTATIFGIIENTLESAHQKVFFVQMMTFFERLSRINSSSNEKNRNMLFSGENSETHSFGTNCLLPTNDAIALERKFKLYKSFDNDALANESKRLLKESYSQREFDLSLIDMIKSSSNIELNVRSYSSHCSLVSFIFKLKKKKQTFFSESKQIQDIEVPSSVSLN